MSNDKTASEETIEYVKVYPDGTQEVQAFGGAAPPTRNDWRTELGRAADTRNDWRTELGRAAEQTAYAAVLKLNNLDSSEATRLRFFTRTKFVNYSDLVSIKEQS